MEDNMATLTDAELSDMLKQKQSEILAIAKELNDRGYVVNAQELGDRHCASERGYRPSLGYRITVSKTEINTVYV